MKEQAAYSLLYLSGNAAPTSAQVEAFMKECGVSCDKAVLKTFFERIEGQSVTDLVAAGSKKHVSMPTGGGGGARPAAAAAAVEEEKKEEKKEEVEDVDMGGLFGGDDDDAEMEEEIPTPDVPAEVRRGDPQAALEAEETATEKSELPAAEAA